VTLVLPAGTAVAGEAGKLTEELWNGLSGDAVSNLTSNANFPNSPTTIGKLSGVEPASNIGDNYGRRLRGWITAPATGSYTFWIAGDNGCQLWLSTDSTVTHRQMIAEVPGSSYTSFRQYDKYASQKSATISLVQGRKYYLEVLHKEGSGGDNLSLAWQPPGFNRQVIPASVIDAYEGPTRTIRTTMDCRTPGSRPTGFPPILPPARQARTAPTAIRTATASPTARNGSGNRRPSPTAPSRAA